MRNLYRSLVVVIALFAVMSSVTGMLLNHTTELRLDKQYLTWEWLSAHYDVKRAQADAVYLLDQKVISQFGRQVFIDTKPVTQSEQLILGGVALDDLIVVATGDALLLFSFDGDFIERMSASDAIPSDIQNIGLFHGDPVIQTRGSLWRSDFMLDQWEQVSLQGVGWSAPQPMPESLGVLLAEYFQEQNQGITLEQFLLDIHNGHILGQNGIWIFDLLGILLVILLCSGLWRWTQGVRA